MARRPCRWWENHEIHLILMDIMMPELDGIRTTAKLREGSNVPIILLTAKSEDTDKNFGPEYRGRRLYHQALQSPGGVARVKSQLRRYTALGGAEKAPGLLTVGPIAMDDGAKVVTVDGEPVASPPLSTTFCACS